MITKPLKSGHVIPDCKIMTNEGRTNYGLLIWELFYLLQSGNTLDHDNIENK